jgi:isopentenyl-diphosphate Delta-isomerase
MPKKHSHHSVILVDNQDRTIGTMEKLEAHKKGLCHRAFSVFIVRKVAGSIQTLLQQRTLEKYHSGGLWSNSCCSHPRPQKDITKEAELRLQYEMGLRCKLIFTEKFHYQAKCTGNITENEWDYLFIGQLDSKPQLNPNEAMAYRWINLEDLQLELQTQAHIFTPWLHLALEKVIRHIPKIFATENHSAEDACSLN